MSMHVNCLFCSNVMPIITNTMTILFVFYGNPTQLSRLYLTASCCSIIILSSLDPLVCFLACVRLSMSGVLWKEIPVL